jgi:hypothetical protein
MSSDTFAIRLLVNILGHRCSTTALSSSHVGELPRNTVKKHLRSAESKPKYPGRVSSSKLDPYTEKLATWPGTEATKSRKTAAHLDADLHTQPKKEKTKNLSVS